jgi:hypothetical protein
MWLPRRKHVELGLGGKQFLKFEVSSRDVQRANQLLRGQAGQQGQWQSRHHNTSAMIANGCT